MKRFFSKIKYKNIIICLSIIIVIVTLNFLKFPAFTEEVLKEEDFNKKNSSTYNIKASINNNLTPISTISTKDYIEMNLYDYGTNINNKNLNNKAGGTYYVYPGFVQSKGTPNVDFSQFSDQAIAANANNLLGLNDFYYLGDYVVSDYNTPTAGVYSASSGFLNFTLNSQYDNTINRPLTKQMHKELVNGYPYFKATWNGQEFTSDFSGSLDYLFSDNTYANKYANLDGLFQYDKDTGLYYYSSRDNHAELQGSTFKVYNQIVTPDYMKYPFGNFLPFNYINTQSTQVSTLNKAKLNEIKNRLQSKSGEKYQKAYQHLRAYDIAMSQKISNYTAWDTISTTLNTLKKNGALSLNSDVELEFKNSLDNLYNINYDEEKNFFFGFDMKLNFMQTKDGLVGKNRDQKMIFRFEGDDDVWVYIDGHLFLDLSGVHAQVGGEIDFHDGVVRYYSFDKSTFSAGNDERHLIDTVSFQEILGTDSPLLVRIDSDTYRFKDYSTPELRFYYLERGASSGVMTTMFNLPLINEEAITISKEVSSTESTFGNPNYKFQVMKNGSNKDLFIGPNHGYDVYDSKTDTKLRSEVTDQYGFITLNKDEYAIIDGIKENAGKYYVRELMEKDLAAQYVNVTIDGKNTNFSSDTVKYGDIEYVYVSSNTKDMYDTVRVTDFVNIVGTLGKLKIKKTLDNINDEIIKNTPFKFKVEINGELIPIGTKYKIGTTSYKVTEKGYIELKPTQEAIIDNIFKNTTFKVVEVLNSTDGLKDRYVLDNVSLNTKYASGTVTSISIVEVINSEAGGAFIKIPVKKITTNPDGIGYTYTFILYDDKGEVIDTKELTVDPNTGIAESSALFEFNYSRIKHPDKVTTYQYTIVEDKKTKLGDIVVNNDKYTSYDESVYDIEVKVTNDSTGFNATYKVNGKEKEDIVFNNSRLSSLTIKKNVESSNQVNTVFNFDIEGTTSINGSYKTSDGKNITFTNGKATVSLKHNESVTIEGLPYGSKFKITETNSDGYVPMYKVNTSDYVEGSSVPEFALTKRNDNSSNFGVNYDTKIIFKNVKGYELPKTGSSGMLVMTSISIILISIFPIYLLKSKRKQGEF